MNVLEWVESLTNEISVEKSYQETEDCRNLGDKSNLIAPPHQAQTVTVTNIQQNMGGKER